MRGPSAVPIQLDSADRAALEQRVRCQSTPKRLYLRAKVVLLAANGWSNTGIAAKLDYHRESVVGWRRRFAEAGMAGLSDRPRSGRPPTFSP